MKRLLIVFISIFFVLCCACTAPAESTPSKTNSDLPENMYPIGFDSYDEMLKYFVENKSDDMTEITVDIDNVTDDYKEFVDKLSQAENIYIPMYAGKALDLMDEDGVPNIYVFRQERYQRPWIWYYCKNENDDVIIIKTLYLSESEIEYSKSHDVIDVMSKLDKTIADSSKISNNENVYTEKMMLSDRYIFAWECDISDCSKQDIMFVYDGLLVNITAPADADVTVWLAKLNFSCASSIHDAQIHLLE